MPRMTLFRAKDPRSHWPRRCLWSCLAGRQRGSSPRWRLRRRETPPAPAATEMPGRPPTRRHRTAPTSAGDRGLSHACAQATRRRNQRARRLHDPTIRQEQPADGRSVLRPRRGAASRRAARGGRAELRGRDRHLPRHRRAVHAARDPASHEPRRQLSRSPRQRERGHGLHRGAHRGPPRLRPVERGADPAPRSPLGNAARAEPARPRPRRSSSRRCGWSSEPSRPSPTRRSPPCTNTRPGCGERGLYQLERDQYDAAIRIITDHYGKNDLRLVTPLLGDRQQLPPPTDLPDGKGIGSLQDALAILVAQPNRGPARDRDRAARHRRLADRVQSEAATTAPSTDAPGSCSATCESGEELRREWFAGPVFVLREPIDLRGLSEDPNAPRGHVSSYISTSTGSARRAT